MDFLRRFVQRLFIFSVSVITLWIIVIQVFERLDQRLPLFLALFGTYVVSAYFLLPTIIRFSTMILGRGHIPRVTSTGDGLTSDPVNVLLTGTAEELMSAFAATGWVQADPLTIRTGWKTIVCFLLKKPYPTAPFSHLYLFGRRQDYGFQEAIGNSPRARNHVRFWAANIDPRAEIRNVQYWMKDHPVDRSKSLTWVGAAVKDTGLGFTRLTYQVSHRFDKEIDEQRDYLLETLKQAGWIQEEHHIHAGELVARRYVSDGNIVCAKLVSPGQK